MRSVISDICLGALRQVNQREEPRDRELTTKRERFAQVERELEEFKD